MSDQCEMALKAETGAPMLDSTLTCPICGHRQIKCMPTNACQWFYECMGCHNLLKPLPGHCCVFCSYGDVPCPPIQVEGGWCNPESAEGKP
jgi:hypothetical protein